jgi:hypothetical protein
MRNKTKVYVIVAMVIITITALILTKTTSADNQHTNIEKMTKTEMSNSIMSIIESTITSNDTELLNYKDLFTEDCLEKYRRNVVNTNIITGIISEKAIDIVTPQDSETSDTVLMCNIRLSNNENIYNKIYLFEFHINADGKIYGYNIWTY